MSKKLQILKNYLEKKQDKFTDTLQNHIDTVKQSNGQPLNDKGKKGSVTLNQWKKQNNALLNQDQSIEKTKMAIERELQGVIYSGKDKIIL